LGAGLLLCGGPAAGQGAGSASNATAKPAGTNALADPPLAPAVEKPVGRSLSLETQAGIKRGVEWLVSQQKPDGSWSNTNYPALTGLALWALLLDPAGPNQAAVSNAVKYILTCVQTNGGIYREIKGPKGGGLGNYNTALCAIALNAAKRSDLTPVILNARRYLVESQHLGKDIYDGGFGYDQSHERPYADMNNSIYAMEAMRLTEKIEDQRPAAEKKVDLNWPAAQGFVTRCQNDKPDLADEYGGFFYRPNESKAGIVTNKAGLEVYKSQGGMTYAGLLALRYAKVGSEDERVKKAIQWSQQHWNLEQNTGTDKEGLYSYYNVLAKALVVYGDALVSRDETVRISGRQALIEKLITLQKIDPATGRGYWLNESGRYWESDPVLTTAYAVIALGILLP
jgi:squalene-hopene/tetraprenyl-beta-curcumene cyclase